MPLSEPDDDLTLLITRLSEVDLAPDARLIEMVYAHLRRIAREIMRSERHSHTLQPTALANEAWLRLNIGAGGKYADRKHFFSVVATTMRHVMVDHARGRSRLRRNPDHEALARFGKEGVVLDGTDKMVAMDQALNRLEQKDARLARIVELRCFCDLSVEETAAIIGLSPTTVKREWRIAKTLLLHDLGSAHESPAVSEA